MIKQVTSKNIDDAGYIHSKSWQASHKGIVNNKFLITYTRKQQTGVLKSELKIESNKAYMIYEKNIPLGIINLNIAKGKIKCLYVLPECWGKGYGKQLLLHGIQELRQCEKIFLIVMNVNRRARKFYEKNGFVYSGEEKFLSKEKCITEMKYGYIEK